MQTTEKIHLLGMSLDELQDVAKDCGLAKFTAKQMAEWIYKKRISSIDEMTNISLSNRAILNEKYDIGRHAPIEKMKSTDGTVKYLFSNTENKYFETVMIPDDNRVTLCISSQMGCKMDCLFCMTGKQGFSGNLSANDILNQIYSVEESELLTNLVLMGMGEPLDNYDTVKKVIEILTADYALAWSPKRITLSTIGLLPKLKLFLEETSAHLAISIHNPYGEERLKIMPIEKTYHIEDIVKLLKQYDWSKQRRLSFEYIVFDQVNDSLLHAKELSKLLNGIRCRINLIPFHQIPNVPLKPANKDKMVNFRDFLSNKGFTATIRTSRGEDINAACGMLSTLKNKNN